MGVSVVVGHVATLPHAEVELLRQGHQEVVEEAGHRAAGRAVGAAAADDPVQVFVVVVAA